MIDYFAGKLKRLRSRQRTKTVRPPYGCGGKARTSGSKVDMGAGVPSKSQSVITE